MKVCGWSRDLSASSAKPIEARVLAVRAKLDGEISVTLIEGAGLGGAKLDVSLSVEEAIELAEKLEAAVNALLAG